MTSVAAVWQPVCVADRIQHRKYSCNLVLIHLTQSQPLSVCICIYAHLLLHFIWQVPFLLFCELLSLQSVSAFSVDWSSNPQGSCAPVEPSHIFSYNAVKCEADTLTVLNTPASGCTVLILSLSLLFLPLLQFLSRVICFDSCSSWFMSPSLAASSSLVII